MGLCGYALPCNAGRSGRASRGDEIYAGAGDVGNENVADGHGRMHARTAQRGKDLGNFFAGDRGGGFRRAERMLRAVDGHQAKLSVRMGAGDLLAAIRLHRACTGCPERRISSPSNSTVTRQPMGQTMQVSSRFSTPAPPKRPPKGAQLRPRSRRQGRFPAFPFLRG